MNNEPFKILSKPPEGYHRTKELAYFIISDARNPTLAQKWEAHNEGDEPVWVAIPIIMIAP